MNHQDDPSFGAFYELCSMIINVLKIPPLPIPIIFTSFSSLPAAVISNAASPAVFASLFIGISLALILFGMITLLIGFVLLPVVIAFLLLFYFFNLVSILSNFARSLLCPCPLSSPEHVSAVLEFPCGCCC